jgi:hypothetical protein
MIKPIAVATMMLAGAAMAALAQSGNMPSEGQPKVVGPTGTMYDGNNANLQLPPERNAYWGQLWAEPDRAGVTGAASAVGAAAGGSSLGGTTGGGEH